MITCSLQSGSNGNCIYVEVDSVRLLFDAGISGRQARCRLEQYQRNIRDVDALILSHAHGDHVRHAGVYQRLFHFPIHATQATLDAAAWSIGKVTDVHHFTGGDSLRFGDVTVHTIPTPHDAEDSVAFVVEHDGKRLGILTDLGHPFAALADTVASLDAVYLESNYDPDMLEDGPYPEYLKERIRGDGGHISNEEAAELLARCARLPRWIALAHLSHQNNTPELALAAARRVVDSHQRLYVASRYEPSDIFVV